MKRIFVGNLDFAATEDAVRALFEPYGTVDNVSIVTDRDTGRSRGFAFVDMSDSGQAEAAINALNGASMDGRKLNVNEARPKTDNRGFGAGAGRPSGGGGFNRGGGGPNRRREPRW